MGYSLVNRQNLRRIPYQIKTNALFHVYRNNKQVLEDYGVCFLLQCCLGRSNPHFKHLPDCSNKSMSLDSKIYSNEHEASVLLSTRLTRLHILLYNWMSPVFSLLSVPSKQFD